jgi:hypothetical protein
MPTIVVRFSINILKGGTMKVLIRHGLCGLLMCISVNALAENATHYLVLGDPPVALAPYNWLNKDLKIISSGISDENGHAIIEPEAGVDAYYLELWNGTQFPVTINKKCWQQPQKVFETCVEIGQSERSPALIIENNKALQAENKRLADQQQSVNWVYDEIKPEQVHKIMDAFLKEHELWWQKNQIAVKAQISSSTFKCNKLNPDIAKKAPYKDLNEIRALGDADKTRAVNISEAKKGNWSGASRLVIEMLANEDWESATPVIAWMMHHKAPAAYNRMADLIGDTSSYESGSTPAEANELIHSLVWHGAMLGDPGSQHELGQLYKNKGRLGDMALKCAIEQRPDFK